MTLRCLYVDFNSFFASVEQQDRRDLRARPVGVVPVLSPTTCCIAASIEAKEYGIKTGTLVSEAVEKYPDIALIEARPARYVEVHEKLMDAIEDCIHHEKPASIDEVPCLLMGRERERDNAIEIARRIKRRIAADFDWIKCSIGIAPNQFLAKTSSDMHKPDGLTVLGMDDLPQRLHALELRDFCGIGASMEQRLHDAGITTSEQLCGASRDQLRHAWGSIEGERFWMQLRGFEVPQRKSERGSIGHSHVLGPELRNYAGARSVLFKLLAKAAMRLRKQGFTASGLAIRIRFVGLEKRFERDLRFAALDDTPNLLHLLGEQLAQLERAQFEPEAADRHWNPKRHPPLSVAVTLVGLEERAMASGELIGELDKQRRKERDISAAIDAINRKYGNNSVYFGAMQKALERDAAPMRIPFAHVPQTEQVEDVMTRKYREDHDLYARRERQFKTFAQQTHQKHDAEKRGTGEEKKHFSAGAGGWGARKKRDEVGIGETRPLF